MQVEISYLPEERWREFRDLRLESLQLDSEAFNSDFDEEKDFTEEVWKKRSRDCLFAFVDDNPIGMVVFLPNNRVKKSHVANIYAMYVKNEFRGNHIGLMLLTEALRNLKRNDKIIKVNLSVNAKQTAAYRLYERIGFKNIGKYSKNAFINGEYHDEILMEYFFE